MSNHKKDKVLETAKLYLQLGTLLKKKRPLWAKEKVEKIIAEDINNNKKINHILKIDKTIKEQNTILKKKNLHNNIKKTKKQYKKTTPIKKLKRENILSYILFQYKKIVSFGIQTKTLKPYPLTLGFKIDHNVGTSLYHLNSTIKELLEPLYYLVENSWVTLNKEQYNLIIVFYDFCSQYNQSFLKNFDYTDIMVLEDNFLTVIQKNSYKQMLIDSFREGIKDNDSHKPKLENYINNVKKIIEPNIMLPSLTHIILALHMVDLRQFINIKELIYTENPPSIKKNRYLAPDNVIKDIQTMIAKKSQAILSLEEEIRFMEFANKLLFDKDINPNFSIIIEFLNGKANKIDIDKEKNDLINLVLSLLKEYISVFKAFTLDKIKITTKDNNVVEEKVTPYALDNDFRNIMSEYRQIMELNIKDYNKLSFEEYKTYINTNTETQNNKANFFIILKRLSKTFYELSFKLFHSYFYEKELIRLSSSEKMKLAKNKDLFEKSIPYSKGRINLNYYLSNKTCIRLLY